MTRIPILQLNTGELGSFVQGIVTTSYLTGELGDGLITGAVTSLNNLSNVINITGVSGNSVYVDGQNIVVAGNSADIAATGQALYNQITGLVENVNVTGYLAFVGTLNKLNNNTGNYYNNSNPSGFATSSQVSGLVTGLAAPVFGPGVKLGLTSPDGSKVLLLSCDNNGIPSWETVTL
jgi:hypothetical protein